MSKRSQAACCGAVHESLNMFIAWIRMPRSPRCLPNCSNADINGKGGSMHEDQFSAGTLMTYNKDRPMSPYILFCGSGKWGMRVEVCGHPSHSFVAVGPQRVVGDHQDH